jgi:hypothetical protein
MDRRDSMKLIVVTPFVAGLACRRAADVTPVAPVPESVLVYYAAQFFSGSEFRTVRVLADMIIPADERSGSASDAYVPEFIDFTVNDRPALQTPVRGGLHWLDSACRRRFGAAFAECSEQDRTAMLEDIAWPDSAPEEYRAGVAFFNTFRDLVASGFWSSRMGVEDLGYTGNVAVASWEGCPTEALDRLGVSYD